MEEKLPPNPESNSEQNPLWYQSMPFRILLVIIICILCYLGIRQISNISSKSIFTQYDPLYADSIDLSLDSVKMDSVNHDSIKIDWKDSTNKKDSILLNNPDQPKNDSLDIDLFSVNTSYERIKSDYGDDLDDGTYNSVLPEGGLFEELLLPESLRGSNNPIFNTFYEQNILAPKSILKLLPIAGKNILIKNNSADDEAILDLLTESESVVAILVVNRKGTVVYSTNRKQLNRSIGALLPQIAISETTLSWQQVKNSNIVSLPLFHTYGKIGTVILISKME